MSRTVYLHVGIAKTGTTYLQRTLFANRELLRRHGTLYPGPGPAAHFLGSLDLRGTAFKGHVYDGVDGAWQRLVAAADEFDGTTLISHETLARAKPADIERAVTGFGTDDVRVVVTCRDLARQIPAAWQESMKNRGETGYDDYLAHLFTTRSAEARPRKGFWVAQDVEDLVRRWSEAVGVGKVTVVTVPRSGADRGELWRRFASATGLPDVAYLPSPDAANSSLGVAEAELLRRLNPKLANTLDWPGYDVLVKRRLAEDVLAPLDSQGRLRLPATWVDQVRAIADAQIAFLQTSGVTVVGDLSDLEPEPADASARYPDSLTDGELLASALEALAVLAAQPQASTPPDPRQRVAALRRTVRRVLRRRSSGV
ncbi:MAG: hypothetical protein WKF54_04820 [Nocardioidaceae bacterium]